MSTIASKHGIWLAYFAFVLLALGCGGRTTDGTGVPDDPGSGNTPPTSTPPPTCNDICRHVVDSCFPGGVVDQCARDCEKMRSEFMGCPSLDGFLRCNLKARVICGIKEAIIDDCYGERDDLTRERNDPGRCKS